MNRKHALVLIMALAIVSTAGCSMQPAAPVTAVTPPVETQEIQVKNTKTYTSDKYKFTLEYPAAWQVMDQESEEKGIIITAKDRQDEWGGTGLNMNFTWEAGDPGMGWKETKNTEITNPDGIKFALNFNIYDEAFYKQSGESVPNKDEIIIAIGTDAFPGLKTFSYDTKVNPDGEKQLMEILNSIKKIQ